MRIFRNGIIATLAGVLATLGFSVPANAATFTQLALSATVNGTSVTTTTKVSANPATQATYWGVCARDAANGNFDFNRISGTISTTGSTYTSQPKTLASGTYRYWPCVLVGTTWYNVGAEKTFTVGTATPTPTPSPSVTPSPTVTPTPSATPTPSPSTSPTSRSINAYVTGYSYYDNTPPGSATISNPVIHQTAGGTGTFADPITVAVGHSLATGSDVLDWPAGTKFYMPYLQRYFIVEDTCGDGPTPQNGPCHTGYTQEAAGTTTWLDIWVGGQVAGQTASDSCMGKITGAHNVLVNPASNYLVTSGEVASGTGGCSSLYGETAQTGTSTPTPTVTPSPTTTASPTGPKTNRLNVSFASGGVSGVGHIFAAGLDWTKPVGLMIYGDGSAEYGLANPNDSYLLDADGTTGLVEVARARNMVLLTPRAPGTGCPDGDGVCWYADSSYTKAQKTAWANAFVTDVKSQYPIATNRIVLGGYSSGAQLTTQQFGPLYAEAQSVDLMVAISYGGKPKTGFGPNYSATYKANTPVVWDVGTSDPAYQGSAGVTEGYNWYTSNGFAKTELNTHAGTHSRSDFDIVMAREIDQYIG